MHRAALAVVTMSAVFLSCAALANDPAPVIVTLSPNYTSTQSGEEIQFRANVLNSANSAVQWYSCAGSISASGLYSAPDVTKTQSFCVVAISVADPSKSATSYVRVSPAAQIDRNGPPRYEWAYRGTAFVPTPSVAPFDAADPAGTVKGDSTLSINARIVRLTDTATGCYVWGPNGPNPGAFTSTVSGGAEDVNTNQTETLVQARCSGGMSYVIALNPRTLQIGGHSGGLCPGGFTFSQAKDNVAFCRPNSGNKVVVNGTPVTANGTSVYSLTFPYSTAFDCGKSMCPDPSQTPAWQLVVDFAQACAAALNTVPIWSSLLSVEAGDTIFNNSFSWVGGQDTGHLNFTYMPGKGCQTVDTSGNGTNPLWYSSRTAAPQVIVNGLTGAPLKASWNTIHGTVSNGTWVSIAKQGCAGADCGTQNGPPLWKIGSNVIFMLSALPKFTGHHSMGKSYFYDDNWPILAHPFSDLAGPNYLVGWYQVPGCSTCRDDHFQADRLNDTNPLLGSTGGAGSEIYAIPTNIPPVTPNGNPTMRFVKTYTSGIVPENNFWAKYAIGAPGQKRTIFCWASDMLGQLGKYSDNTGTYNRSDEFCVGLAGQ